MKKKYRSKGDHSLGGKKIWQEYRDQELKKLAPILDDLGFELEKNQVHIGGERYVSGGKKLVLLGQRKIDGQKIVIKASSDQQGIEEIQQERQSRNILQQVKFAYRVFYYPDEILFREIDGLTIFVMEFIEQTSNFIDRPLEEQFFLALKAFEAQEGVHITTYEHGSTVSKFFQTWKAKDYLNNFDKFQNEIKQNLPKDKRLEALLEKAGNFLDKNQNTIDLYCDFLTHWDFVPHNLRIRGNDIYLLDYSSIRFGNKYEGWARFVNFMSLYNPDLEKALLDYVKDNRGAQEYSSLGLMRVFRLAEIIWYYSRTLDKAEGNVLELNKKRIDLWTKALEAVLENKFLEKNILSDYKNERDRLRDAEEIKRQKNLH